jgi:hypothetical protein
VKLNKVDATDFYELMAKDEFKNVLVSNKRQK